MHSTDPVIHIVRQILSKVLYVSCHVQYVSLATEANMKECFFKYADVSHVWKPPDVVSNPPRSR